MEGQAQLRRNPQFNKDPGYFIAPIPFNAPGIGGGIAIAGVFANVFDSYTDIAGFVLPSGDVQGAVVTVSDVHLIEQTLIFDLFYQNASKITFRVNNIRGMDSDPDDFTLVELDDQRQLGVRLNLSFFERVFEISGILLQEEGNIKRLRDPEGEIIADAVGEETSLNGRLGILLDLTDDALDPRVGIRFDARALRTMEVEAGEVDQIDFNYNTTLYLPIGESSTWVFNYFRSDASVIQQGETDLDQIKADLGTDCSLEDDPTSCEETLEELAESTQNGNRFGSATSLGGLARLRSYPFGRFVGAHSAFWGTEFRWNLTDEQTPFDILFMKGIRTAFQLAFFYEEGSVSEKIGDLGNERRSSAGVGFRLVTSGIVYRVEVAGGDEGTETTVIVGYPWETLL